MLLHRSVMVNCVPVGLLLLAVCLQGCASRTRAPVSSPGDYGASDKPATVASQRSRAQQSEIPSSGYHVVSRGDTLYAIAWRYRLDYRKVARWNDIGPPYTIYPGDKIRLRPPPSRSTPSPPIARQSNKPSPPLPRSTGDAAPPAEQAPAKSSTKSPPQQSSGKQATSSVAVDGPIEWDWPTQGKLIQASTPTAEKGINIGGRAGQTIRAAAPGQVVYSGSGLIGYGKLIIIKHNNTFLSAYAHNDELLVKEGDSVSGGQRISTMGADSDGRASLHFEIRRNGQPIDPLKHLPKRQG